MCKNLSSLICCGLLFCYISVDAIPAEPKPLLGACNPNPCGENTNCIEQNGAGSCQCLPEYYGDAYEGCRPECVLNSDCPSNKACIRNKCQNPCPGDCGDLTCAVDDHNPYCNPKPVESICVTNPKACQ